MSSSLRHSFFSPCYGSHRWLPRHFPLSSRRFTGPLSSDVGEGMGARPLDVGSLYSFRCSSLVGISRRWLYERRLGLVFSCASPTAAASAVLLPAFVAGGFWSSVSGGGGLWYHCPSKGRLVQIRIITGVIIEVITHNTSHTRFKHIKWSKS
jgi:hypothetical protein